MNSSKKETSALLAVPPFTVNPLLEPHIKELERKNTPESHALAALLKQSDVTSQEVKWQSPIVLETKRQATKTNGRVNRIEFIFLTGKIVGLTLIGLAILYAASHPGDLGLVWRIVLKLIAG